MKIIILLVLLAVLIGLDGDFIRLKLRTWRILDAVAGIVLLASPFIALWITSR